MASKYIFSMHTNMVNQDFTRKALRNGTRILVTQPWGIENFLISGFLDINYEAQVKNGEVTVGLWNKTKHCRVVSDLGTDISLSMEGRRAMNGDGVLTEDGEIEFSPGVQVSIAPIEETKNGKVVIDASDNIQWVFRRPYTMYLENGAITRLEGGFEATTMEEWLRTPNDPTIYKVCHFTIGLTKAGIVGNMCEDERLIGSVDFGFGNQPEDLGGTVGKGSYHMDIILSSPTIFIDDVPMIDRNKLNYELGYLEM